MHVSAGNEYDLSFFAICGIGYPGKAIETLQPQHALAQPLPAAVAAVVDDAPAKPMKQPSSCSIIQVSIRILELSRSNTSITIPEPTYLPLLQWQQVSKTPLAVLVVVFCILAATLDFSD